MTTQKHITRIFTLTPLAVAAAIALPLRSSAGPQMEVHAYTAAPAVSGEMATAHVLIDGKAHEVTPNQTGAFHRLTIATPKKMQVEVAFPDG
jgi:hypothetical protein